MSEDHKTVEITDENFDEMVLKNDKVVVVDYWAEWCGPCKLLGPIVDDLAGEMEGKAVFGKMDVQIHSSGTKYGVSALPTLMFFKNGKKVDALVGVQTKAKIKEIVQKFL
jgi:thioredoxin 1